MKTLLACLALLSLSCTSSRGAGRDMRVAWPDKSENDKLWACFPDEELGENGMSCLNWGEFLKIVAKEAREQDEAEGMNYDPENVDKL